MSIFIDNKYTDFYNNIISKAKSQNRKRNDGNYYERHHIIPKSMGGKETVLLTAKEHIICHWLLTKMISGPDKYKMFHAFKRTVEGNQHRAPNVKLLAIAKEKHAEATSRKHKGKIISEATRLKMREAALRHGNKHNIGRKFSDETKAKMSASGGKHLKGKPWSDARRQAYINRYPSCSISLGQKILP